MVRVFLADEGAKKIAIFGSYVRDKVRPESDLDVLVEFRDRKSLLDIVRIERLLSERLAIKVDLLTESAISPYLIEKIRREMEIIYQ